MFANSSLEKQLTWILRINISTEETERHPLQDEILPFEERETLTGMLFKAKQTIT